MFSRPRHFIARAGALLGLCGLLFGLLLTVEHRESDLESVPADRLVPTFAPTEGFYEDDITINLSVANPDATILFTTDGAIPQPGVSETYQRPIRFAAGTSDVLVVTARVRLPDGQLGPPVVANYFALESTLPVLSVAIDPAELWDSERGIFANVRQRGREWERRGVVTYLEPAREDAARRIGFHVPAGIRVHGGSSRGSGKESIRLYFRAEYGLNRLEYPLFTAYPNQIENSTHKRLVVHSGGQDYGRVDWTLLRAHLTGDLADQTVGYTTQTQPAILYLNGELQGIYNIRNRPDRWFYQDVYGLDTVDETEREEQWQRFQTFLSTQDLGDPATYAMVEREVDIANFIDYIILNFYIANTDWIFANTEAFRPSEAGGPWRWAHWDVDWSYGLVSWGGYEFDMFNWLETNDRPGFDRGALLIRKLLENDRFRQDFVSRAADLLNSALAPLNVEAQLMTIADEMRPDIGYERDLWTGPSDWESSVEEMLAFVRNRPDYLRQHIVDYFGLDGLSELRFEQATSGRGRLAVNGLLLPKATGWIGTYFQGTEVVVTAVPDPGQRFAGWESQEMLPSAQVTITVGSSSSIRPIFEPAGGPRPNDVVIHGFGHDGRSADEHHGQIEGDWIVLRVQRRGGTDLRGWRLTDNDTKLSTGEGSLVFGDDPSLARVPFGTRLLLVVTRTTANDRSFPTDDLGARDGQMLLYVGNGLLDGQSDPWFNIAYQDNLALLAPGSTTDYADDRGIAFAIVSPGGRPHITPYTFGILADGVTDGMPVQKQH